MSTSQCEISWHYFQHRLSFNRKNKQIHTRGCMNKWSCTKRFSVTWRAWEWKAARAVHVKIHHEKALRSRQTMGITDRSLICLSKLCRVMPRVWRGIVRLTLHYIHYIIHPSFTFPFPQFPYYKCTNTLQDSEWTIRLIMVWSIMGVHRVWILSSLTSAQSWDYWYEQKNP